VYLFNIPNPAAPTGVTQAFVPAGGNIDLRPERATTWNVGFDLQPASLRGLRLSTTYFHIRYEDRIAQIPNLFAAFINPENAVFVSPPPSAAEQASLIAASATGLQNFTGAPYNPQNVQATVDFRNTNVSSERARGVDALIEYTTAVGADNLILNASGTYLDLEQKFTSTSPVVQLSGQTFQPSKWRARAGATYVRSGWEISTFLNYVGKSRNNFPTGDRSIPAWTTVDAQIAITPNEASVFRFSLSAQNLFDKDPPPVTFNTFIPGIGYDSTNHSPLGRSILAKATARW
jgi:outer membrane cobalamin receptor